MIYLDCESSSLKADIGILIAIGLLLPDGDPQVLFADTPEDEKRIIVQALDILKKYRKEKIYIWNTSFDIPFILTRAIKHDIDVSELYSFDFIDLCKFARNNLKLASNKLDEASKFLGISKNLKVTGKNIQRLYMKFIRGNEEARNKIIEHCKDDIKALKAIHQKIKSYSSKWKINRGF